ncbi:hypothetical protein J4526_09225 [Desulfurococcaceae archaeon MEX13E-LK6-19]|nr:hypothetical protein J4526_09225 [Desulfurococcaceae archaeon MEX13E-LK6-19]
MAELLEIPKPIKYLKNKGIENGRIYRGYRLASKSSIVYYDEQGTVRVFVPSQRLGRLRPVKPIPHMDLKALAEGRYKQTVSIKGKLPVEQQYYVVELTPNEFRCNCPDTIINKNPLCVHKIAALIRVYIDLGENYIEKHYGRITRELARKYKEWRKRRLLRKRPEKARREGDLTKILQDEKRSKQS